MFSPNSMMSVLDRVMEGVGSISSTAAVMLVTSSWPTVTSTPATCTVSPPSVVVSPAPASLSPKSGR